MDYISHLPPELIEHILLHEGISPNDVENLGLTCKRLHNSIWENKNNYKLFRTVFFKRWPALREMCYIKWQKSGVNIGKELKKSLEFKRKFSEHFSEFVHEMEYRFNLKKMVYFMENINRIFNNAGRNAGLHYYYLQEELMTILAENRDNYGNLTQIYYAKQLLVYLKHRHLEKEWQEFIKLPVQKQLFERAAVILSQWCQPEKRLFYWNVSSILNNIRQKVLIRLQKDYPSHTVFSVSSRLFSFWEKNNIECSYWDAIESRQIIIVLRKLIRKIFDLCYDFNNSYLNHPMYFFIDIILKNRRGNYLLLSLIFGCVARRLGVRCDLIGFYYPRSGFLLCWKEDYDNVNPKYGTYYNIDFEDLNSFPFLRGDANIGRFINLRENMYILNAPQELLLHMNYVEFLHRRTSKVNANITIRLFKYFICIMQRDNMYKLNDAMESLLWHKDPYVDLTEYWSFLNRDATGIMINDKKEFNHIVAIFEKRLLWQTCIKPKKRTKEIKYAIGTCIQIEDGQRTAGVITAWDEKFVDVFDPLVIGQFVKMGSNSEQPFYKILCCDDISFYVGEDIITPRKLDAPITHQEIGRYFKKFMGTHYEPNKFLQDGYPDDATVLQKMLQC